MLRPGAASAAGSPPPPLALAVLSRGAHDNWSERDGGELHDRLALLGAGLMVRALAALERGTLDFEPQASTGVTYAAKIDKAEAQLDWSRSARALHNHVRGLSPFPGAWFETHADGRAERVKVLRSVLVDATGDAGPSGTLLDDAFTVACGVGSIRLEQVQRAGRKAMSGEEALKGIAITPGTRL